MAPNDMKMFLFFIVDKELKAQIIQSARLSVHSSELGPPSPGRECCSFPLQVQGGRPTHLRERGVGDPIPKKGQTLWYFMFCTLVYYNPFTRLKASITRMAVIYTVSLKLTSVIIF
jgi:hypothetical protein